ncbi:hypothetical protein H6G04_29160 [Calothrix membranacea FACHB-236]|nr:hypothetical protein [Calothrix membranacea FACHB-236]
MRYSIMLQVVATITLVFLGTAALFAWLQYRPGPEETNTQIPKNSISVRKE